MLKNSGMYEIKCDSCGKIYLDQTKRQVIMGYKDYLPHIKYNRSE